MPGIGEVKGGRYEITRLIAQGGTSRVYLVTDRHIGRSLAMKVMDRNRFGSTHFARSEIESLRCLKYPMFPQIHDAFTDGKYIYIVSEYVRGTSLSHLCGQGGLGKYRCLAIAEYICEALIYLHGLRKPLLYLDLKPENIIISDDGMPRLIDFGIAGTVRDSHMPVGTRGYCPPEQYESNSVMDERADIFAFGQTYYAIRCGVPPDPDADKALSNIRRSGTLGQSEKSFLVKCCAVDARDRYTSAREVLKQIRHIRSTPNRIRKTICIAAVAAAVTISGGVAAEEAAKRIRQNRAADDLVLRATRHMKDGQYTPEGIGIIKACINSGNLSYECEQEFIFEVAMNSLLIERDYRTAAKYFKRLDEKQFPMTQDYLKLCMLQNGFDYDPEEAMEIVGKLYFLISQRKPSKMKYDNLMFIALCFENYSEDPYEGALKALSVLRLEKQELVKLEDGIPDIGPDGTASVIKRLDELIEVENRRIRAGKKMIGESNEN